MKVAMLGWEFPPFMAGGLGIHCLELTLGMADKATAIDFYMPRMTDASGPLDIGQQYRHLLIHEVDATPGLSPYGAPPAGGIGAPRAEYTSDFNHAVWTYNQRLVDAFASHDADVLHCHDWITVEAGLELRRRTGIPLVFTVHSTEFDRSGGFYPQTWIEDIERRGVHEADRVIAVSKYTKQIIEQQYGADPDKVVAIENGIDPQRFHDHSQRDYRNGRDAVLFLARLSRQKGPMFFMQTARRVLEVRPNTTFVVAGQGELLPDCIDYTIRHGIQDRVRFAGYVPASDLADFYSEHDIYVLPSVSEPFGISVLEAMATGLPTIVTKTSGVGAEVRHALKASHWDVDEMADMIIRLLESPELREEIGRRASQEVGQFTWGRCAQRTLEAYRSVQGFRRARIAA